MEQNEHSSLIMRYICRFTSGAETA